MENWKIRNKNYEEQYYINNYLIKQKTNTSNTAAV